MDEEIPSKNFFVYLYIYSCWESVYTFIKNNWIILRRNILSISLSIRKFKQFVNMPF